jgi:diacylglycerol kinase family enzyme
MFVTNPAAGERHAKAGDLERCDAILRSAGFILDRVETGAESPTSADLARRAVDLGYEACIVAGGDGTVAPAAATLLDTKVVLGILPFGSVMNIAHGLGLPLEPVKAAEVIARRRVLRADAGEVREKIFFETARESDPRDERSLLGWSLEILPRVSMTDGLLAARPVVYRGARIRVASDDPVSVHADGVLAGGLPAEFACRKGALQVFA